MRAICAGQGEIGKAVKEVFGEYHDIFPYDTKGGYDLPKGHFDILLVCFPWQENFVDIVKAYINLHHIKATIIFSTVPIGTTRQIPNAVHSPIEGRHENLAKSILLMRRFVGGFDATVYDFFLATTIIPKYLDKPEFTEFIKLRSTSRYGVNIEFSRYEKEVCKNIGMDYRYIWDFDEEYNSLYRQLGEPRFARYILTPPTGNIGGHCVVPNAKLLDAQYPSIFLKEIYRDKEETHE